MPVRHLTRGKLKMAEQKKAEERTKGQDRDEATGDMNQSGDPGRTPGSAEGDEQTVEESLRQKESSTK